MADLGFWQRGCGSSYSLPPSLSPLSLPLFHPFFLPSLPFFLLFPFPSPNPARGSGGAPTLNLMRFKWKIWHLVRIICVIFTLTKFEDILRTFIVSYNYNYRVACRKKTGPAYLIANILKTPWPNCVEIGELMQYYMLNTVIIFFCLKISSSCGAT